MRYNEAEQAFYDDVREKKKAANGVHGKTGKNGYVGTMRFPTDIMSRKEKIAYRKAGAVVTTNIFDEILTIDEFNKLEEYEQKNRLQYWRNKYSAIEVKSSMGIGAKRYYDIIGELGLPKAPRGRSKGAPRKAKAIAIEAEKIKEMPLPAPVEIKETEPIQEIIFNGLQLIFNGTFSAEHIQNQILKFASILDNESDDFYIEFKIRQKSKADNKN